MFWRQPQQPQYKDTYGDHVYYQQEQQQQEGQPKPTVAHPPGLVRRPAAGVNTAGDGGEMGVTLADQPQQRRRRKRLHTLAVRVLILSFALLIMVRLCVVNSLLQQALSLKQQLCQRSSWLSSSRK